MGKYMIRNLALSLRIRQVLFYVFSISSTRQAVDLFTISSKPHDILQNITNFLKTCDILVLKSNLQGLR